MHNKNNAVVGSQCARGFALTGRYGRLTVRRAAVTAWRSMLGGTKIHRRRQYVWRDAVVVLSSNNSAVQQQQERIKAALRSCHKCPQRQASVVVIVVWCNCAFMRCGCYYCFLLLFLCSALFLCVIVVALTYLSLYNGVWLHATYQHFLFQKCLLYCISPTILIQLPFGLRFCGYRLFCSQ